MVGCLIFFPYFICWSLGIYQWYIISPWLFFIFFNCSSKFGAFLFANSVRFSLVECFFTLLNAWWLSCMAILHSSLHHHNTGLFLIFCCLRTTKALSATDVMVCWNSFIILLIWAGSSSESVSFSVSSSVIFSWYIGQFHFLYSILVDGMFELRYCLEAETSSIIFLLLFHVNCKLYFFVFTVDMMG